MKGQTPLMMSSMLMRDTPQTTLRTTPTGGVIRPIALLMMNSPPNKPDRSGLLDDRHQDRG